ncbi:PAS domain S-box protein [Aeromicrobium sp.]|nr:PAS domain S-box protein [Candidatus Saccharibacteria bacterium]
MSDSKLVLEYGRLFRALPHPYIAFATDDPLFTIVEENDAHGAIAFSNPADTVGKPVFEVFPDTTEKYRLTGESDLVESFRRVIATGKPDIMPLYKYDVQNEDGEFVERWWRVSHYPVFDEAGSLSIICQSTEDITELRLTEQKLEQTSSQLESALEIGLVSTWSWDIASDVVVGDANLARSFGVTPEAAAKGLPLKIFTDSIHPDDQKRVLNAIQKSIKHGAPYEEEYRAINKHNDTRWMIARGKSQLDTVSGNTYFLGVNVDITERKEVESELKQSKTMFDALFESTILSVAMADLNGKVLQANKTFLKTFGYSQQDLRKGITSLNVTSTKSRGVTNKIYDTLRLAREVQPIEKEYVTKDGTTIPMLVGAAMLPGSDDTFMAFMLDISENKELKALNAAKDEFIGMASHQLRTPATVVKQYLSLLQTGYGGELSDEQLLYIEKANNSNERQLKIINDLLKTAQIDSNRFILKKQTITASKLVSQAVNELADLTATRMQQVVVDNNAGDDTVYVDVTELNLILVNLIENASKYSPANTTITIQLSRKGHAIAISISDEGVGIDQAYIKHIFQKFTRVDNELSDTVSGTGLGLYWVEQITKLHGGTIEVLSKIGKGSTFIVCLPRED